MELIKGIESKPYRIAIYGPPGVGKSTIANSASRAVFLNIEDALHHIDCIRTPVITGTQNLKYWLGQITTSEEMKDQFDTICLDTIDALEDILIQEICEKHNRESLASFGFGQGFDLLNKKWLEILSWVDLISRKYNKNFILIGHDQIRRFEDPLGDGYDRITLKMHHKSALSLVSKMDAVLYMTWDKVIRKSDSNIRKAIGTGKRLIYSEESPAFLAKNRYQLNSKMEVNQNFFAELEDQIRPKNNEPILETVNEN